MVSTTLTEKQIQGFHERGYFVARGLLSPEEAAEWRDYFMAIHARGTVEGYFAPRPMSETGGDMLKAYPRMLNPHRWDETAKSWMLDARLFPILKGLFGEAPLAAQSMFYFKPPGARGQAMHQDDFYLKTSPGHCMAAWFAIDAADAGNGVLSIVPRSHRLPVLCPHAADLTKSFTIEEVDVPAEMEPVQIELAAGDVLFFNGATIHGSGPNASPDRFRRSFICHYVPESTHAMASWYSPLHNFNGDPVEIEAAEGGGPCGTEELMQLREGILMQGELARVGIEQGAIALP